MLSSDLVTNIIIAACFATFVAWIGNRDRKRISEAISDRKLEKNAAQRKRDWEDLQLKKPKKSDDERVNPERNDEDDSEDR